MSALLDLIKPVDDAVALYALALECLDALVWGSGGGDVLLCERRPDKHNSVFDPTVGIRGNIWNAYFSPALMIDSCFSLKRVPYVGPPPSPKSSGAMEISFHRVYSDGSSLTLPPTVVYIWRLHESEVYDDSLKTYQFVKSVDRGQVRLLFSSFGSPLDATHSKWTAEAYSLIRRSSVNLPRKCPLWDFYLHSLYHGRGLASFYLDYWALHAEVHEFSLPGRPSAHHVRLIRLGSRKSQVVSQHLVWAKGRLTSLHNSA
jgi:hypothetical protein